MNKLLLDPHVWIWLSMEDKKSLSRVTGMPLVTLDKRLRQLQGVETIW